MTTFAPAFKRTSEIESGFQRIFFFRPVCCWKIEPSLLREKQDSRRIGVSSYASLRLVKRDLQVMLSEDLGDKSESSPANLLYCLTLLLAHRYSILFFFLFRFFPVKGCNSARVVLRRE